MTGLAHVLPEPLASDDRSQPYSYRCRTCGDTGAVLAQRKGHRGAPFAFACPCPIGRKKNRRYPEWSSDLLSKYEFKGFGV